MAADGDVTRTMEGAVLGTAAYMSPEQAQGRTLDERSDIFSFGAVLYEMLAGAPAFSGDSTADILSAILRDEPRPLKAPALLERIVRRCLAKDAVAAVSNDGRGCRGTATSPRQACRPATVDRRTPLRQHEPRSRR